MKENKRRNWAAQAAIMRKGGVHDKSNKAKRQQAKQAFKRKMRADQIGSFYWCQLISMVHLTQIAPTSGYWKDQVVGGVG